MVNYSLILYFIPFHLQAEQTGRKKDPFIVAYVHFYCKATWEKKETLYLNIVIYFFRLIKWIAASHKQKKRSMPFKYDNVFDI